MSLLKHTSSSSDKKRDKIMNVNDTAVKGVKEESESHSKLVDDSRKIGDILIICFWSGEDTKYCLLMSKINSCEYMYSAQKCQCDNLSICYAHNSYFWVFLAPQ